MAVLSFRVGTDATATISLKPGSTTLAVEGERVSTWDLAGRPLVLVRAGATWKRALDGRLLQKVRARDDAGGWAIRRMVAAREGAAVVEDARAEATAALASLAPDPAHDGALRRSAVERLTRIVSTDEAALEADAARFAEIYRPVGMLPPDQYRALVLQATEGCSWNACTFCDLYRGTRFHLKTLEEFERHTAQVRAFFGEAIVFRRSVFLGDANALCAATEKVLPLVAATAGIFPFAPPGLEPSALERWLGGHPGGMRGLYSFVDVWTGARKDVGEYRELARLGLRRVYVGLETGDPDLLAWLEKPGDPGDASELVENLRAAGIASGVIVLLGAGGEPYFESHARRTAEVLTRMRLAADDLVYFSEIVELPGLDYARRCSEEGIRPLTSGRLREQRARIVSSFSPADPARPPRHAVYDIREFIY